MSRIGLWHHEEFENWKNTRCFIYLVLRCFAFRYVGDTLSKFCSVNSKCRVFGILLAAWYSLCFVFCWNSVKC